MFRRQAAHRVLAYSREGVVKGSVRADNSWYDRVSIWVEVIRELLEQRREGVEDEVARANAAGGLRIDREVIVPRLLLRSRTKHEQSCQA
jgi:hypothetical protein